MSEEKKAFGETGFGQFLKKAAAKLPELAGVAIDIVSGDVGGAIENLRGALLSSNSPEAKELFNELERSRQEWSLEMSRIDAADRANARARENEYTKAGKRDYKMTVVLGVGLGAFVFSIIAAVFIEVPEGNKEIWTHLMGVIEGAAAIPIFTYFFGSSSGSKQKTALLTEGK